VPKFALMKHQEGGVAFLDSVDGIGALLWEPGVGKTGATLAWIDRLADRQKIVRVLVVAPLTAADTWVLQPPDFMDSPTKARLAQGPVLDQLGQLRKAGDWAAVPTTKIQSNHKGTRTTQVSGNRVTIMSMSAGAVSSWCQTRPKTVQMLQAVRKYAPHVIVVDESHIIKGNNANISKAMYQIGQLAPHRIILTGTVTPNGPLDVYGQWRFLAPWTFSDQYAEPYVKTPLRMTRSQQMAVHPWAWGTFVKRFSTPGGHKGKGIGGYVGLDTRGGLNDRVAERSHVVLKKDALDLPPVTDIDIHVTLSTKEQRAYDEMRLELALMLDSGELLEAPNALAKMMKLRQITTGFAKDTNVDSATYGQTFILGDSKRQAQLEVATTQLVGEQRLVVFGYFTSECTLLVEALRKLEPNTRVEIIDGSTKVGDRLAIRQRFGDIKQHPERMILVAQQRTMSISVNELVTAQNGIYGALSERRNDWDQSRGRLDRQGQNGSKVTFWNVYVPDSIDSIMLERNKTKGDLEKALLAHIRATPR
jgi:hypothetical protein